MDMKVKMFASALVVVTISSCIYTFHPLYSDDILIDVPAIEGVFQLDDSGDDDPEIWTFTRVARGEYDLDISVGIKKGKLKVHVVKLGGEIFMDIIPDEYENEQVPDFVNWHLLPMHTITKLNIADPDLEMIFFDEIWLEKNLSSHKIRIAHEVRRSNSNPRDIDFILLTADTEELQKFVEKYAQHDPAYGDKSLLTRISSH